MNPALVHHFFGSKDQVFVAALNLPFNPAPLVDTMLDGPREQIGERILRLFLGLWQQPETRAPFLALLRSVAGSPEVAVAAAAVHRDRGAGARWPRRSTCPRCG